jgi:hypothetical protein
LICGDEANRHARERDLFLRAADRQRVPSQGEPQVPAEAEAKILEQRLAPIVGPQADLDWRHGLPQSSKSKRRIEWLSHRRVGDGS